MVNCALLPEDIAHAETQTPIFEDGIEDFYATYYQDNDEGGYGVFASNSDLTISRIVVQ
jgi:hypothetical protein